MRVGIIALLHESNTFVSGVTTWQQFADDMLLVGDSIRQSLADSHHEIGGFLAGLDEQQMEAVPVFAARAVPSGEVAAETLDRLMATLFRALDSVGSLDGLLVAPHGAMVSQRHRDADGYWLRELRHHVGSAVPIIGTLDPHANLSPRMVAATDALIAYRTNPHLDQRDRGLEAARLMARTLRGEARPVQAAAFPPLAISIDRQLTSDPHLTPLYDAADRFLADSRILSNSILLGFPYADVAEMGTAVLVVADNDDQLASATASELADMVWSHREAMRGQWIDIPAALDIALQESGPVCLLDMGDNIGGGSPADSTHLALELQSRSISDAFVCLYDPVAVSDATSTGVGQRCRLQIGGKTDLAHGMPLVDQFQVLGLYSGKFVETQPRHGGQGTFDQGPSAVVRNDAGLTILITSRRMPPFSLQQLISCGIQPERYRILVAKGVNAPVAAYRSVCRKFIRVNTPGCTTADMTSLDFRNRRRPMFPFEPSVAWPNLDNVTYSSPFWR